VSREPEQERETPWWRTPGAIIIWALVAAAIGLLLERL
jgi:hypothetical protein